MLFRSDIRKNILEEIKRRVKEENSMWHADTAMLFFDAIVCPFFEESERKEILKEVCGNPASVDKKLELYNKTRRWFFNWDKRCDLSNLLSKKEYHSPYE